MEKFKKNCASESFQQKVLRSNCYRPRFKNQTEQKKKRRRENGKKRRALVKSLKEFVKPLKKNIQSGLKEQNHFLTPKQKEIYVSLLKKRKKETSLQARVNLSLQDSGLNLGKDYANKVISIDEIRSFICFIQHQHHIIGGLPRWIKLKKADNVLFNIVLVIEGVGLKEWNQMVKENCPTLAAAPINVPFVSPLQYGGDIISELCTIPLTSSQLERLSEKYSNLKEANQNKEKSEKLLSTMFVIERVLPKQDVVNNNEDSRSMETDVSLVKQADRVAKWQQDKFPRTLLMLTPWQMIQSNYPMPIEDSPFEGFVKTKEVYESATDQSPMFGLDCEMCQTSKGSELTRVSIVNENHEVVYERLVKPYNQIKNYLTRFSGITKSMLENVDTRLEQVQAELCKLLPPDAILVGQSLESDLQALKMVHPFVIDTSVIFNMSGDKNKKTGLRMLVQEFLSERIQVGNKQGHDSIEDALAALKLVQAKLQNYLEWGNKLLDGERDPSESKAAMLLLEQRDNMGERPFVRKYATISICDEYAPKSNLNAYRKKHFSADDFRWNVNNDEPNTFQATSTLENLTRFHRNLVLVGQNPVLDEYDELIPAEMNVVSKNQWKPSDLYGPNAKKKLYKCLTTSNKGVVSSMCNVPRAGCNHRTTVWGHVRMKDGNIRRVSKWMKMLKHNFPKDRSVLTLVLTGSKESQGLCIIDINSLPVLTNDALKQQAIALAPDNNLPIKMEI